MFWISLAVIVMAALMFKLGALSMAFLALILILKIGLVVTLFFAGVIGWRYFRNRKSNRLAEGTYEDNR